MTDDTPNNHDSDDEQHDDHHDTADPRPSGGDGAVFADRLDDLEARAADVSDDTRSVGDFGREVHRLAAAIDRHLYVTRRVRDGELDADTDLTLAEMDDHIEVLTALRERLTAIVANAPVSVNIKTAAGQTKTTVSTDDGIGMTTTWEDTYGATDAAPPVPVTFDDDPTGGGDGFAPPDTE